MEEKEHDLENPISLKKLFQPCPFQYEPISIEDEDFIKMCKYANH